MKAVTVLRKPLGGTVVQNCLEYGCGALNIDGTRIAGPPWKWGTQTDIRGGGYGSKRPSDGHVLARGDGVSLESNPAGRWPANVVLHEKVVAEVDAQSGVRASGIAVRRNVGHSAKGLIDYAQGSKDESMRDDVGYGDTGGASRFFKQVKE